MKYFKSDGRYVNHDKGFHFVIAFAWSDRKDIELFNKILSRLKEIYGPEKENVPDEKWVTGRWKYNDFWRYERNMFAKRRRIYLKEESAVTLVLLTLNQEKLL